MPRLFTGLEIPAEIADRLTAQRGGLPGARWIEPSDYHVTLRFLGDVENDLAEEFHAGLCESRPHAPFAVTLEGLSSFGGDKPRAIIAAIAPTPELAELQAEHERIARRAGAAPERRKFTPHVTLARLGREASSEAVAVYMTRAGLFSPIAFTATRVALFSARASRGGGPYIVETSYPLTQG